MGRYGEANKECKVPSNNRFTCKRGPKGTVKGVGIGFMGETNQGSRPKRATIAKVCQMLSLVSNSLLLKGLPRKEENQEVTMSNAVQGEKGCVQ